MSNEKIKSYTDLFLSRLDTLSHILDVSSSHFKEEGDSILYYRIINDMLPFGTQIAYTCNQPRNFVFWCEGKEMNNLSSEVETLAYARQIIKDTKEKLSAIEVDDSKLHDVSRVVLAEDQYLELPGLEYVNDFLLPNLYFHLSTAYNIMRMRGVALGKANYMLHLIPKLKS